MGMVMGELDWLADVLEVMQDYINHNGLVHLQPHMDALVAETRRELLSTSLARLQIKSEERSRARSRERLQ
jgi:hypothetical protein